MSIYDTTATYARMYGHASQPIERYRAAVQSAARKLDADRPDWFRHVDLRRLKLSSDTDCVFGQVYGYGSWWKETKRLGFCYHEVFCLLDNEFTNLWKRAILVRLNDNPLPAQKANIMDLLTRVGDW